MQAVVHVVVGLIGDAAGRWLVSSRRPGAPLAGFWEFPGGKSFGGEAGFDALRRELAEELGIEVLEAEPCFELTHDYPDKRVRLDFWHVVRYRGTAHGRERQQLRWVAAEDLAALPLLEADRPIIPLLAGLPARAATCAETRRIF